MLHVYTWPTPNGHKIHIMLQETGIEYEMHPVDITAGEQFEPEFLKISPNNRMPVIVDEEGPGDEPYSLFESGAILIYLAEKTGQLMPGMDDPAGRYRVLEWLMFQMGGVGPMLGQNHHFRNYAPEKIPYAIDRYTDEAGRLYRVIDTRLGQSKYLAGDEYTIADIATFPWLRGHEGQGQKLEDTPHLKKWYDEIAARPAVERGVDMLAEHRRQGPLSEEQREVYFGKTQFQKR
ncbi:MAG: glutathione binding-like protein [Alphaproteobacteria bacterium]|nr:glutathione binding-like protein [Alphaproteobacteria bacterium]